MELMENGLLMELSSLVNASSVHNRKHDVDEHGQPLKIVDARTGS